MRNALEHRYACRTRRNRSNHPRKRFTTFRDAALQLSRSTHDMKWALMELERCEQLAAGGQTSPLGETRAAVGRAAREREEALATLHSMGYRARYR